MHKPIYKSIYNRNKPEKYFYMSSSLRDSFVRGKNLITGTKDSAYTVPFYTFKENLSRRTVKGTLPMMYKILEGVDGSPTEVRLVIRVPWGWSPQRFQAEAVREWKKNPSVEMIASCHFAESVDMDRTFLTRGWRGEKGLRLADTEKRLRP